MHRTGLFKSRNLLRVGIGQPLLEAHDIELKTIGQQAPQVVPLADSKDKVLSKSAQVVASRQGVHPNPERLPVVIIRFPKDAEGPGSLMRINKLLYPHVVPILASVQDALPEADEHKSHGLRRCCSIEMFHTKSLRILRP